MTPLQLTNSPNPPTPGLQAVAHVVGRRQAELYCAAGAHSVREHLDCRPAVGFERPTNGHFPGRENRRALAVSGCFIIASATGFGWRSLCDSRSWSRSKFLPS